MPKFKQALTQLANKGFFEFEAQANTTLECGIYNMVRFIKTTDLSDKGPSRLALSQIYSLRKARLYFAGASSYAVMESSQDAIYLYYDPLRGVYYRTRLSEVILPNWKMLDPAIYNHFPYQLHDCEDLRIRKAVLVRITGQGQIRNEEKIAERVEIVRRVHRLLIERGVNTRFLQSFIYFNNKGVKISLEAAHATLRYYLKKKNISRQEALQIIFSLWRALASLHEKNLVHRDVRTANIYITEEKGRIGALLADLDEVAAVKSDGTLDTDINSEMAGSAESPEIRAVLVDSKWDERNQGLYNKINLKAEDCYALGEVLEHLIDSIEPEIPQDDILRLLAKQFTARSPADRLTLKDLYSEALYREKEPDTETKPAQKDGLLKEAIRELDLKAEDCEELGTVLSQLTERAQPEAGPNDPLRILASQLFAQTSETAHAEAASQTLSRAPIVHLPSTPEEKEDSLFSSLKECIKAFEMTGAPHEFIDDLRARVQEEDDYSLAIKKELRPVYYLAQVIDSQIDYFDYLIQSGLHQERSDEMLRLAFLKLTKHFDQFEIQMSIAIQLFASSRRIHESLSALWISVMTEMERIRAFSRGLHQAAGTTIAQTLQEVRAKLKLTHLDDLAKDPIIFSALMRVMDESDLRSFVNSLTPENLKELFKEKMTDAQLVMIWPYFNAAQKNLLAEVLDQEGLLQVLKKQGNPQLELDHALEVLEEAKAEAGDAAENEKLHRIASNAIHHFRMHREKYRLTDKDLPLLTEFVHRVAFAIKNPKNANNLDRLFKLGKQIIQQSLSFGVALLHIIREAGVLQTAGLFGKTPRPARVSPHCGSVLAFSILS